MINIQKTVTGTMMAVMMLSALPVLAQTSSVITPNEVLPAGIGIETGLGTTDVRVTIARIIRVAMGLLGIIAVVVILIGGFTWMTAGGNEEKVGEAKKWIFAGITGLQIVLSAYAIASFVINQLVTATTKAGPTSL